VSSVPANFLLYGSSGFVGDAIARLAVKSGLQPVLAGRNATKIKAQAQELGMKYRVFDLEDATALDQALSEVSVVLHCAGPYLYTFKPMLEGCLRTGAHYLDINGEIPAFEGLAARDAEAKGRGVMLLPGVGFDVVPTVCLALHLKQRLPSATHLTLAVQGQGPAGLPPGTQRTAIEMVPYGSNLVRRNGRLEVPDGGRQNRLVDFGSGPITATRMTWGDIFTAYYSTGIPNIEGYLVLPEATRRQLALVPYLSPLFKLAVVRNLLKRAVKPGPTADERARTVTHVWGEVKDDQGRRAASRLTGPEAGVIWTGHSALAVVRKVLAGNFSAGFQTPARVYGADFALECEGVTREDLKD
jgi:short subunit dehydrogenase-like uncharacterized protein